MSDKPTTLTVNTVPQASWFRHGEVLSFGNNPETLEYVRHTEEGVLFKHSDTGQHVLMVSVKHTRHDL